MRYEIYSTESERENLIDWRSSKKDAIRRAYDLLPKYGDAIIRKSTTGEIVYATDPGYKLRFRFPI